MKFFDMLNEIIECFNLVIYDILFESEQLLNDYGGV